jgi:hypothetical protein
MVQGVPTIGGAPVFNPIASVLDDRVPRSRANRRSGFADREQIDDRFAIASKRSGFPHGR